MNARQSSRTALQKKTRRQSFIETIWDALSGKTGPSRREKQRGMRFEPLEDRKVMATTIGLNFTASTLGVDTGFIPPDTMGAVGPNHIVEMINGNFQVFNKTTGASLETRTLDNFWTAKAGATIPSGTFDPRVIFDPTSGVWFATAINGGTANTIFVARSDTADPTGDWDSVQFIGDTISGTRFNDYDTLGVDADALYISTNNFSAGFDVSVYSLPKAGLLAATPTIANMTRFEAQNATTRGSSIQGTVNFGASDGSGTLLGTGSGTLIRTNVVNPANPAATLSAPITITGVPAFVTAPAARQPSGVTIENVSPRFTGNVVEINGFLWAAHPVQGSAGTNSAVRWYQIDATTNVVVQTGLIEDTATPRDFYDPSIAVNQFGNVVIGYTGSGPSTFASSYASVGQTVRGSGTPVTTFAAPLVLRAGAGNYFQDFGSGRNRWGDYSATNVDPSAAMSFWTIQQFVSTAHPGPVFSSPGGAYSVGVTALSISSLDYVVNASAAGNNIIVRTDATGNEIEIVIDGVVTDRFSKAAVNTLTVNGLGGDDFLTVEYANGNPVPAGGFSFNGGANNDTLRLQGGAFTTITKNFTNATDGNINLDGGVINYTGLAPVLMNVGTVANVIFNLPAAVANPDVVLGDDTLANFPGLGLNTANTSAIDASTFEYTSFTNPTTSLTVNMGNAGNTLTMNALDATFAAPNIGLNGGTGALDTFNIRATPAGVTTTIAGSLVASGNQDNVNVGSVANSMDPILGPIAFNDLGGDSIIDQLNLNDQGDADANNYLFSTVGTGGSISRTGAGLISYNGNVNVIALNAGAGVNNINVNGVGAGVDVLTVNAGANNDVITVNGPGLAVNFNNDAFINGEAGEDIFNVTAAVLGSGDLIHIDGGPPTNFATPDILNYTGPTPATKTITGAGSGIISGAGVEPVDFVSIERLSHVTGVFNDVIDLSVAPLAGAGGQDGLANQVLLTLDPSGAFLQVLVDFNTTDNGGVPNPVLFSSQLFAGVGTITVTGGTDADTLVVDHSNGIVNRTINFAGNGPVNVGEPNGDALAIVGGAVTNETYRVGTTEDAGTWVLDPDGSGGRGSVTPGPDGMVVNFTGLEPASSSTVAAFFDVVYDVADADNLSIVNGGLLNGFTSLQVNDLSGTFETFRFANKATVSLHLNGGADTTLINYTIPALGLNTLEVYGNGLGAVAGVQPDDNANDIFALRATAAGVTANNLFGQGGNDDFANVQLVIAVFSMQGFDSPVTVDGGVGIDRLALSAFNDPALLATVTATTLTSAAFSTFTYSNLDSLLFAASQNNDSIDVLSTQAGTQYILGGDSGNDTITIGNTTANFTAPNFNGSLAAIQGPISVLPEFYGNLGPLGTDTLNVDASGDAALAGAAVINRVGVIGQTYLNTGGANVSADTTRLSGFAAANIEYAHANLADSIFGPNRPNRLSNLNVRGSQGGDNISVLATTAVVQTTVDARQGNDSVTITGDNLSANNTFLGFDGVDEFTLNITNNLGQGAFAPIQSVLIDGQLAAATSTARDRLTINDANAAFNRDLNYDYTNTAGGLNIAPTTPGNGLAGGVNMNLAVQTLGLETVIFNAPGGNNDAVRVTGTSGDDVIAVGLLASTTAATVFLNGNPYLGTPPETLANSRPGVAGGGNGPDILINGITSLSGIQLFGDGNTGTAGQGDRAVVYASSEAGLNTGNGEDIFNPNGFGAGTLIPGFGAGNSFDFIGVNGAATPVLAAATPVGATDVRVFSNYVTELMPVFVNDASFLQAGPATPQQQAAIIVNAGDEPSFIIPQVIADFINVNVSTNFNIRVNGNLPPLNLGPNGLPVGDQLNIFGPGDVNIFSDKAAPPNVSITFSLNPAPFGVQFSSIERLALSPTTGVVNLIGDNNDPNVDQTDNFVVVGRDIDVGNPFPPNDGGVGEMTVVINGSAPILLDNVQFLNVFGDDQNPAPGTPSLGNDIDTLDIRPYSDNTPRGWGVAVAYDEANPVQADGAQADLLIVRTSLFGGAVSEDIVIRPAGPEHGEVTITNGGFGTPVVNISFINNTDIIVLDDDGFLSDTDTLTLRGTNPDPLQTSGNETFLINLNATQTAGDALVSVTDTVSGLILYQLRGFVPTVGAPAPISTITFEGLAGNDTFNVLGSGLAQAPFLPNTQANFLGGEGTDQLNIDLLNSVKLDGVGVLYDGGSGEDGLAVFNSGVVALVPAITNTIYTLGAAVGAGRLTYQDGFFPDMVIDFVNLEPVVDTIVSANLIVNANGASNAINYGPGANPANGLISIDNHETIEFANKQVLTINALQGDDVINLNNPVAPAGLGVGLGVGVPAIIVNGGDPTASDRVIVNGTAGADNVTIDQLTASGARITGAGPVVIQVLTTEGLHFNGQEGGDNLTITTPVGPDGIVATPTFASGEGSVSITTGANGDVQIPLSWEGVNGLLGSVSFADAGGVRADFLTLQGTSLSDNFAVLNNAGDLRVSPLAGVTLYAFTIRTPGVTVATLSGLNGDDTFFVPGNHPFTGGLIIDGGNPSSGSDVLNFGGTGGAVVADYGLSTVTEGANGPVFFTGIEIINANTAGGNLTINDTAGNDVFDVTPIGLNAVTTRLTSSTPVVTNTPVINGTNIGTFLVNAIAGDDKLKVRYGSASETIAVNAAAGTVNVTIPAATLEQVTFTTGAGGLNALEVFGNEGSDTFNVTPSANTTIFIDGGDPIGIVGDTIVINGGVTLFKPGPEVDEGGFQVGANQLISFDHIEAAIVNGAPCAIVTGTNADDDITVIARDASTHVGADGVQDFTVSVNAGLEVLYIGTAMLGIDALAGDDDIVIRAPAPNDAAWNVQVSVVGGSPSAGDPAEGDRLVLETPLADVITYTPTGSDTATIGINAGNTGGLINILSALPAGFCPGIVYVSSVGGVEVVQYDGEGGTDTFNFVGTGGNDTITHTPGAGIDEGSLRLGTLLGVSYQNLGAAGLVRVDGGAGVDTLIAQGTAGRDNFTVNRVSALIGQILVNGRIPLQTTNGTATANTVEVYQIDTLEGDDNVTINYPLAANITTVAVNAGGPGGSDVLTINGDAATVEAFVVSTGTTKGVGNVAVNAVNTPYTGIEHLFVAANAPAQADTLSINDGLGGDNVWTVTAGTVGDLVQIDNRETIDYNFFATVALNNNFGSDTFNVHIVRTSGFSTSLTVNPELDDDIVNLFGTEANDTVTSTANAISIGTALTAARTLTIGAAAPNIFAQVNLYTLGGADNIDLDLGLAGTRKLVDAGSENDTINMLGTLDATIFGGTGDDNIVGTPLADLIFGGSGNDILIGAGGVDTIYGEDGNDIFGNPTLVNNGVADDAGNDLLFGGDGSDTFVWEPGDGSDTIEGGADQSDVMLFFGNAAANAFILSAVATRLELNFGAGAVLMSAAGIEEVDVRGLTGADTFTVNDLFPTDVRTVTLDLAVEAGVVDTVTVGGRNVSDNVNIAQTTATRVSVTGLRYDVRIDNAIAADNDILNFNGNDGNDTIVAQEALTTAYAAANLRVNGGNGDDFISGHGTLSGDAGNDTLIGGAQGQTINGGSGNDQIFGEGGDDTLFGNAGEDTFVGGLGNDTIDGGADWDTIMVTATSANDRIDVRQNQVIAGITQLLYEISNQFTPGVDGLVGGAGTETDSLVTGATATVEEVRVVAGSGDDQIRATHSDQLIVLGQQAFSVRMTIDGGAPGASDRLTVQDDGLGDTTIHRIGGAVGQGSFQVGALAPVVYLDVEYASLNPVNAITGATGTDNAGRLIVFPFDSREQNQTLTNATFLGGGTADLTGTIDPGVDPAPGFGIAGDEDWFRVVAPVTGVLDFQVYFRELAALTNGRAGLPGNGNLDIGVYDADGLVNGNPLAIGGFGTFGANDGGAELDTAPSLANERVRIPAVAGQTYYVRIGGAAMLQDGTPNNSPALNVYNLSVVSTAAPVARDLELDDVIAQSTVLAAPAPTATTFTAPAAGLSATAGFYVGKFVYFTSGPLNGQRGLVTAYNGAGAFTFAAGTFTGAPAAGDAFQVESVDSGRSQVDNTTRDNTPTIFFRLDDAFLLNDLPGNPAGQTNAPPPDQIIPITYQINGSALPSAQPAGGFNPGFRVAIFDETDTHNPVNLGYATPVNATGLYTFTFTNALTDGSHFLTAKVEMIDPADTTTAAGIVRATGFGAPSQSLEIVVDTGAPPVSFGQPSSTQAGREFTLTDGLHPDSDSGVLGMPASFNDNITNVLTPKVFGTAEADGIVRVYIDNLNTATYPGTVVGAFDAFDVLAAQTVASPLDGTNQLPTGRWDTELTVSLNDQRFFPNKDGVRTLFVTLEDTSGNVNPANPLNIERLNLFVDTQGPQVTDVRFNSVTSTYNVFDHKNEGLPQGPGEPGTLVPTPVVNSIIVKLQDLPTRQANFFYQAIKTNLQLINQPNGALLNGGVDVLPLGLVTLTGDAEGIIPIRRVTFTADQNPNTVPIDAFAGADIARGYLTITFGSDPDGVPGNADDIARSLPDDRFTLRISDSLQDPVGNKLDGETQTDEPHDGPRFPSGDGIPGADFVSRFTVDTRPEVGTWAAGSVYIDINGNELWDPTNPDFTNRDIAFVYAYTADDVFAGNFSLNPGSVADGFDKLGAYGRVNGQFRWLIDTDNDGVPNLRVNDPANFNGLPSAGDFDGNANNGDEVAVFNGTTWMLDTNHDYRLDTTVNWPGPAGGYPVVGDFDGDNIDDLAAWNDDFFRIDLGNNGYGQIDVAPFRFGFIGVGDRPVAADMNQDGFDDLGLWVPSRGGVLPQESGEFFFLVSGAVPNDDGNGPAVLGPSVINRIVIDSITGERVVRFQPVPFGNDLQIQFGDEFALPIVGNFDPPPVTANTPLIDGTNPRDALDVNNDGFITGLDALIIVDRLNVQGPGLLEIDEFPSAPFYDVNGDGYVTGLDALIIADYLNIHLLNGEGEDDDAGSALDGGEGEGDSLDDLIGLLASGGDR